MSYMNVVRVETMNKEIISSVKGWCRTVVVGRRVVSVRSLGHACRPTTARKTRSARNTQGSNRGLTGRTSDASSRVASGASELVHLFTSHASDVVSHIAIVDRADRSRR